MKNYPHPKCAFCDYEKWEDLIPHFIGTKVIFVCKDCEEYRANKAKEINDKIKHEDNTNGYDTR